MNHEDGKRGSVRTDHRRDGGYSFLEVLVAVVVLGTAGVAVMAGLAAAATGAATHREISAAQAELSRATDALTRAETDTYVPCAQPSDYQPVVAGDVSVTNVQFWNGTTWVDSCGGAGDQRLQRVTMTHTTGSTVRELQVVKRPLSSPTADLGTLPDVVAVEDVDFDTFDGYTPGLDATTTTTESSTTTTTAPPGTTTTTVPETTTTTTLPDEECTVQITGVSPSSVTLTNNGELSAAVTVTISTSGDCDDLDLYVETGQANNSYTVSFTGNSLTATLPANDLKWKSGTRTLTILDGGSTIATSSLVVN